MHGPSTTIGSLAFALASAVAGLAGEPELVVRLGHTSPPRSVAISGDSRFVVTGGDGGVQLWDARSGELLRSIVDGYSTVAVDGDGSRVLSVGITDRFVLSETATGESHVLETTARMRTCDVTADGRRGVVGGNDTIEVWDLERRRRLWQFTELGDVMVVACSDDGETIAAADLRGGLFVWNGRTGEERRRFEHGGFVHAMDLSGDGRRMVTGDREGQLRVWDTGNGERTAEIVAGKNEYVVDVSLSADGGRIVAALDGGAVLYDVERGTVVRRIPNRIGVRSVALGSKGFRLATASPHDGPAKFWPARGGEALVEFRSVGAPPYVGASHDATGRLLIGTPEWTVVFAVERGIEATWEASRGARAFSPDGRRVAAVFDRELTLRDVASGDVLWSTPGTAESLDWSPDGSQFAVGKLGLRNVAVLHDATTGRPLRTLEGGRFLNDDTASVHFVSGTSRVVLAGADRIDMFDAATGRLVRRLERDDSFTRTFGTPDGRYLVELGRQRGFTLHGLQVEERHERGTEYRATNVVPFSEGRFLLVGEKGELELWGAGEKPVRTFPRGPGGRFAAATAGRTAWWGNADGSLTATRLDTGAELLRLHLLRNGRDWLAVTPEGRFDGTDAGLARLAWRVPGSLEFVPDDGALRAAGHEPGLLAKAIGVE